MRSLEDSGLTIARFRTPRRIVLSSVAALVVFPGSFSAASAANWIGNNYIAMSRTTTRSLFGELAPPSPTERYAPLPERMRPRSLAEFVGQTHLVGEGRILRRLIEGGASLPSLILWGAPGT